MDIAATLKALDHQERAADIEYAAHKSAIAAVRAKGLKAADSQALADLHKADYFAALERVGLADGLVDGLSVEAPTPTVQPARTAPTKAKATAKATTTASTQKHATPAEPRPKVLKRPEVLQGQTITEARCEARDALDRDYFAVTLLTYVLRRYGPMPKRNVLEVLRLLALGSHTHHTITTALSKTSVFTNSDGLWSAVRRPRVVEGLPERPRLEIVPDEDDDETTTLNGAEEAAE